MPIPKNVHLRVNVNTALAGLVGLLAAWLASSGWLRLAGWLAGWRRAWLAGIVAAGWLRGWWRAGWLASSGWLRLAGFVVLASSG